MKSQYVCFSLLIFALVLFLLPIISTAKPPVKIAFWNQTDFWFRDDDGTEISATGFGSSDGSEGLNITDVAPGTVFRLRFGIGVVDADGAIIPRLEFKQGTDCAIGDWTAITSTSDIFNLRLSDNFINGDATTKQITNGSFVPGKIMESTDPAPSLSLNKNKDTEYEWSIEIAGNIPADTTYSFRISDDGNSLDGYGVCPALISRSSTPEPVSASSDRGGAVRPTIVTFSGKAFPGASIFIMDKDIYFERMLNQNIVADENGIFKVDFIGILQSQHSFGLVIKDKEGRSSQTKFFNIDTLANDLVVKDILAPPTVGFVQGVVTRGQNAVITGYATPGNEVKIEMGDIKKEVKAGKDGLYKAEINTGVFEFGQHKVRVKQFNPEEKKESDFSITKTLAVSRLVSPKTDFSGDGRVDIKDWSIFLSHWVSKDKDIRKEVDLNGDGKIDISDFAIFIQSIRKL